MTNSTRRGAGREIPYTTPRGRGSGFSEGGQLNAHLTERFRSSPSDRNESVTLRAAPMSSSKLTKDVRKYYDDFEAAEKTSKWQTLEEVPTTAELLKPSFVLMDDASTNYTPVTETWGHEDDEAPVDSTSDGNGDDEHKGEEDEDEDEIADLDSQEPSRLKAFNKIEGPWSSKEKYLRTHYKLLREDALRRLRLCIETFKSFPMMDESTQNDIGLYDDVRLRGITFAKRGLGIKVSFSLSRVGKKVGWNQSKRLMTGSLVALIPAEGASYDVDELKVAVIAARPVSQLEKNPPEIDLFFARPDEIPIDNQKKWLMLEERSGFFEAERHTLVALQKMVHEKTPLLDHLVSTKAQVPVPEYVSQAPDRNLRSVYERTLGFQNILSAWPSNPETLMDQTQQQALHNLLTKQLAIVQGPPGTGKTFVSVQALKVMLANHLPEDPPIIITCQTNHALDQLLRHVALIEPNCFVRLGGRSKDKEVIKPRTLFEVREQMQLPRSPVAGAMHDLDALTKGMRDVLKLIIGPNLTEQDSLHVKDTSTKKKKGDLADCDVPMSLAIFQEHGLLSEEQCVSIERAASRWNTAGGSEEQQDALLKWVGTGLESSRLTSALPDLFEFEEAELDVEELREIEAETALFEEDEVEYLKGDYHEFRACLASKSGPGAAAGLTKVSVLRPGGRKSYKSIDKLLRDVQDLSLVDPKSRPILIDHLMAKLKGNLLCKFRELVVRYDKAVQRRKIGYWELDSWMLKQYKVRFQSRVPDLRKYRALVASLKPRTILIEEAAEALEAPVIATCVETLQNLILIGDHQQLRPHTRNKELEDGPYYLNISLFERMIKNKVEFTQLQSQRRMIPEVRRLIEPIYGDGVIKDHPDVLSSAHRPAVPGMKGHCTWFFDHTWAENRDNQTSCYNQPEAAMVVGFVKYLMLNGVSMSQITLLTFYNGQRREVRKQLRNSPVTELREKASLLKIVTVDAYQGEENDIVLLSLVRSNTDMKIGFLENINRVCVALSRAQRGFYMFGNSTLLRRQQEKAPIWRQLYQILRKGDVVMPEKRIGSFKLPLGKCEKHDRELVITEPGDWEGNDGGCDLPCGETLGCGHACKHHCHPLDHSKLRCTEPCVQKLECGHACKQLCSDACQCTTCEKSKQKVIDRHAETGRQDWGESAQQSLPIRDASNAWSSGDNNWMATPSDSTSNASPLRKDVRWSPQPPSIATYIAPSGHSRRISESSRGSGIKTVDSSGSSEQWQAFSNGGLRSHDREIQDTGGRAEAQNNLKHLDSYNEQNLWGESPPKSPNPPVTREVINAGGGGRKEWMTSHKEEPLLGWKHTKQQEPLIDLLDDDVQIVTMSSKPSLMDLIEF